MTQEERVLKYLRDNGSITSLAMFNEFFICCPQGVIRNIRASLGQDAITDLWETKKRTECKSDGTKQTRTIRYKRYFLKKLEAVNNIEVQRT